MTKWVVAHIYNVILVGLDIPHEKTQLEQSVWIQRSAPGGEPQGDEGLGEVGLDMELCVVASIT
jgi:hypothetical protein